MKISQLFDLYKKAMFHSDCRSQRMLVLVNGDRMRVVLQDAEGEEIHELKTLVRRDKFLIIEVSGDLRETFPQGFDLLVQDKEGSTLVLEIGKHRVRGEIPARVRRELDDLQKFSGSEVGIGSLLDLTIGCHPEDGGFVLHGFQNISAQSNKRR